jgi:hypothetical protein
MEQYLKVFLLFQLLCDKNSCLTWRRNNASQWNCVESPHYITLLSMYRVINEMGRGNIIFNKNFKLFGSFTVRSTKCYHELL